MLILTYTNQTLISTGGFFLRIMTGLILFVAGAGKVLGWFGGFGMEMTLSMFQSNLNLSAFWAYVSSYAELIGGFLLLIGLFTRFAALVLFINMLVAVVLTGTENFFMGGAAYPCLLMICSLFFLLAGPLKWSADNLIPAKRSQQTI